MLMPLMLATALTAVSPDGRTEIRLEAADGALRYSVLRDGKTLLSPADISLSVRGKPFSAEVVSDEPFELKGELETPLYKKRAVSLAAKGRRIALKGGYGVELIARDDGVAYRFTTAFPEDEVLVDGETAPLAFPSGDVSVWAGYPDVFKDKDGTYSGLSNWEPVYTNLTSAAVGMKTDRMAALPLVAEYAGGTCLSVTESDQRDYPGWLLRGSGTSGRVEGWFAREPVEESCEGPYHTAAVTRHDYIARTAGTRTYPWRLFQVADAAAKLCEGDAVHALAEPCRLDDTSWIRPGLAQWEWWHAWNLTGVGFKAGVNTETYLHYIDFAAEHGVPYVIMDGGWSKDYKLMNAKPSVDLKRIAARAVEKGVGIILWSPWAAFIENREEMCRTYAEIGIRGFKLDGICRNDRYLTKYLEDTARIAAKYRLVIDYHGVSKPSGLNRTYPNVLTYEGVHGLENTKWEGDFMPICDFPRCDLTDYFCRMTAGAMDYTPGAMRNFASNEYHYSFAQPGSQGTRVRQLALFTLFESPLQMLCDSPSAYRREAECFRFISRVPTVWDETRGLLGKIGEFAAVARRSGETWYVGAMTDWTARELEIPTDFLGNGTWTAEIFEDGVNADRDATDYVRRERSVTAGEPLRVRLAPGGGWTARLVRDPAAGRTQGPGCAIRLADAVIVRTKPSDAKAAAGLEADVRELTNVIFRTTGALPPVLEAAPPDAKAVICIGAAAERASGADLSGLRRGDWRVKADPGRVHLLGRTPAAVTGAMVEFCERFCDYRFLTLEGDDPCTYDPELTVPVTDVTVRPALYCREVYHAMYDGRLYPTTKRNWVRLSRLRRTEVPSTVEGVHRVSSQVRRCHSQYYYIHPDTYFKDHPEYYSMKEDGRRSATFDHHSQLCYTSDAALDICYESLVKFVEKDRAEHPTDYPCIYDFTQHDNDDSMCLCPECRKVIAKYNRVPGGHKEGGDAGLQLEFVNKLARRIRAKYPDVQIRVFAYVQTECPPKEGTIRPEPNVVIWWCDVYSYSDHTLPLETAGHFNRKQAEEIDGWLRLTKNVQVWDYMIDSPAPEVNADALAADAGFFAVRSLPDIFVESEYRGQPFYLLNYYLMSELYIDPTKDVDALVRAYCRVYGNAAAEMEEAIGFLRRIEAAEHATTPGDWHNRLLPWLSRANMEKLAAMLRKAYDKPGLTKTQSARIAEALAATWKQLVLILKQDPNAAAAFAAAQKEWVRYAKTVARDGFMEPSAREKASAKVDEELELLTLKFKDLPPELKDVPEKDLVCVDYHFGSPRVRDDRSERGWAVTIRKGDGYYSGKLPVPCGVYDNIAKTGNAYRIETLPADGSYAWVKLGPAYIGRNSIFWFPGSWQSSFGLKSQHILEDGLPVDPNHYEVWASARLEDGKFFIDRLAFRRVAK